MTASLVSSRDARWFKTLIVDGVDQNWREVRSSTAVEAARQVSAETCRQATGRRVVRGRPATPAPRSRRLVSTIDEATTRQRGPRRGLVDCLLVHCRRPPRSRLDRQPRLAL